MKDTRIKMGKRGQIESWADLLLLIAGGIVIMIIAMYSINSPESSEQQLYQKDISVLQDKDILLSLLQARYETDMGNITLAEMIDMWYSSYTDQSHEVNNPYFNIFDPVRKALDSIQGRGIYKIYIYETPDYGYVIPGGRPYNFIKSITPTRITPARKGRVLIKGEVEVVKVPTDKGDLYLKLQSFKSYLKLQSPRLR